MAEGFEMLIREVQAMRKEIADLRTVIARDKILDVWIPEKIAAPMIGLAERTLRKYVKKGLIDISYTAPKGRNYQYSRRDIKNYLQQNSTAA